MLRAAINAGIKPEDLAAHLGRNVASWLVMVEGSLDSAQFAEAASRLSTKFGKYSLSRFFCSQEDLIHIDGKTFAVSNQWAIRDVPAFDKIAESYPELNVQFTKANA